ncbi:hypothetical protein [Methylobacterium sp. MA0201]|uniref:hypothetical protein n=1 Tax=Methylobacterium alsaeris TaxID=3344826 RepID=UPI003757F664
MSTASALRERLGLPAETRTDHPTPSGILAAAEFVPRGPIAEPVSLARALRRLGFNLAQAHRIVTGLTGEAIAVRASGLLDPRAEVLEDFARLGVAVTFWIGYAAPLGANDEVEFWDVPLAAG